jgi:polyhydroxyalkanoate synthesis regulator phasin
MHDDEALLRLAARAAGYKLSDTKEGYPLWIGGQGVWNALDDNDDAFRLAVNLKLNIQTPCQYHATFAEVSFSNREGTIRIYHEDAEKATRMAIVEAAAHIGRQMEESCPDCGIKTNDLHKCVNHEQQKEIDGLRHEVEVLNRRVKELEYIEARR